MFNLRQNINFSLHILKRVNTKYQYTIEKKKSFISYVEKKATLHVELPAQLLYYRLLPMKRSYLTNKEKAKVIFKWRIFKAHLHSDGANQAAAKVARKPPTAFS